MIMHHVTYQFGIGRECLCNTLSGERLLPETLLDLVHNFGVTRIRLVEHVLQSEICRSKTIAEVLGKDPSTICVEYVSI